MPATSESRRARSALALSLVVAACLSAPALAEAPSTSAGPSTFTHRGTAAKVAAARLGEASAARTPVSPTVAPRATQDPRPRSASRDSAALTACNPDSLWGTPLADRTVLHLNVPGATSFTLTRTRNLGAPTVLATLTADAAGGATYIDRAVNSRASYSYTMEARGDIGVIMTCASADLGRYTMDGVGEPELVGAADTALVHSGFWDASISGLAGGFSEPAFSADGRQLAVVNLNGDIIVTSARTGAARFTLTSATEYFGDPAFSPDGQTIAFSRYSGDGTGTPVGLGFADVFGAHSVRLLSTTFPVIEPAYRPDGLIVASAFDSAAGLAVLCSTCTSPTPIAGTEGGYSPEVAPNGAIHFAVTEEFADNTHISRLQRINGSAVSTVLTLTDSYARSPKVAPDGRLFYQRDYFADPADALPQSSFVIQAQSADGDGHWSQLSHDPYQRLWGFDVRQPQTKGSSHGSGNRIEDLYARDSAGVLWVYPRPWEIAGFSTRVRIGGGWNSYTQIITGDITSDDVTDLLATDTSGVLWNYRGLATGGYAARVRLGSGWSPHKISSPGDFTGDDLADLISRDTLGRLWLFPGTGRGSFSTPRQIGSGWASMTALLGAGDLNLDNAADLVARDSAGALWLYPGNGSGGFLARRQIGSGWSSMTGLAITEVANQVTFLHARTSTGLLYGYAFFGDGRAINSAQLEGSGWTGYLFAG